MYLIIYGQLTRLVLTVGFLGPRIGLRWSMTKEVFMDYAQLAQLTTAVMVSLIALGKAISALVAYVASKKGKV